jgi:hypothetical protein
MRLKKWLEVDYRVLCKEDGNGDRKFYPQYKRFYIWSNMYKNQMCLDGGYLSFLIVFDTKEEAENHIKEYIEKVENMIRKNKIKKEIFDYNKGG